MAEINVCSKNQRVRTCYPIPFSSISLDTRVVSIPSNKFRLSSILGMFSSVWVLKSKWMFLFLFTSSLILIYQARYKYASDKLFLFYKNILSPDLR